MLVYFIPILVILLFSVSITKSEKKKRNLIIALMLFLCFGYMTGSDWRSYEQCYHDGFLLRLTEPGYMWLSNRCSEIGIPFWLFHISLKCISYISILYLIVKLNQHRGLSIALLLWYASFGLFLFIDCPFRSTIVCGLASLGFLHIFRENKKGIIVYYCIVLLACLFHTSSAILLIVPLLKFDKIGSIYLVGAYVSLFVILLMGGDALLQSLFSSVFPSQLVERLDFYMDNNQSSLLSPGLIPRFLSLYLLVRYRTQILELPYGKFIFNYGYFYLILGLIYYTIPILFRASLFFAPFYVSTFASAAVVMVRSKAQILRSFVCFLTFVLVFTVVRSYKYVPYTNILPNIVTWSFYDYSYRDQYNPTHTPYNDYNRDH